ncbi:hypothetical protein KUTeg_013357 [Tegillarca granosa]|uniref:Protein kinase domain-containing protein n=1 Tax=Tegillarca granosa TaxID=220873 RepID=A0ABQ9ETG1_TEGGR|nr:hypothetical protein KUTeg_013357 [Tegillarca granosa]
MLSAEVINTSQWRTTVYVFRLWMTFFLDEHTIAKGLILLSDRLFNICGYIDCDVEENLVLENSLLFNDCGFDRGWDSVMPFYDKRMVLLHLKDGSYWACKKMKQTYDSDKKSGTLVLVCELMDMNIYELIKDKRHYLPDKSVKKYLYQLCKSLDHIHRNGIFHRDVKPENILIKEDLLKLADFGSCRSVYSKQPYTEYISTRWYRAPECLLTDGYYNYKMDMWSSSSSFPGSNEVDQIAKIHDIMGTPDPSVLNKLKKDADRRAAQLAKTRQLEEQEKKNEMIHPHQSDSNVIELDTSRTEKTEKSKKEQQTVTSSTLIPSLPKAQSLPTHPHIFKDKKKRRHRRLLETHQFGTHTGLNLPKVPLHASTINPSFHSSSFSNYNPVHNTSSTMSLLPSINSTYKPHKLIFSCDRRKIKYWLH